MGLEKLKNGKLIAGERDKWSYNACRNEGGDDRKRNLKSIREARICWNSSIPRLALQMLVPTISAK
jgi:hypothetical protein